MKAKTDQYLKDLAEIRDMMDKSTKFLSLSGLSGILVGIFALIGAILVYPLLYTAEGISSYTSRSPQVKWQLLLIGLGVLALSLSSSVAFTLRKAKTLKQAIWGKQAKRLIFEMAVPLIAGGILSLVLLFSSALEWVFAMTLTFYGLALFNAGRMTYKEIRTLGLLQIAGGLAAALIPEFGLFFWGLGFGVLHIVYGVFMHFQYESKS